MRTSIINSPLTTVTALIAGNLLVIVVLTLVYIVF